MSPISLFENRVHIAIGAVLLSVIVFMSAVCAQTEDGITPFYGSTGPVYLTELAAPSPTKTLDIPDGYKLVEIKHPDAITCTAVPVASTWAVRAIAKPKPKPVVVGAENYESLLIITEGE